MASISHYSAQGAKSPNEGHTSTNYETQRTPDRGAPEDKRLSAEEFDTLHCIPVTYRGHAEPIESIILGSAFDQLFFAQNPDRQFLVREAFFDRLTNDYADVSGTYHFV